MKDLEINQMIRDEIEKISMPDYEKDLIYSLLYFERKLHSEGKITFQQEYQRQLGNTVVRMEAHESGQ